MVRPPLHRSGLLLACLAAFGVAASAAVACGTFGEAAESVTDAAASDASPADASLADGGESCAPGAFCDSFDDAAPLPRAWSSSNAKTATLSVVPGAGRNGSGGLVATVMGTGASELARLKLDLPAPGPPSYDAVMSFWAQAKLTTAGVVLGPRFFVDGAAGGGRGISVTFKKGLVRLDPDTCDGGSDCVLPKDEIDVDEGWHRYVLTLSVRPTTASSVGDFSFTIDGKPGLAADLPMLLSSPASYGFLFGVSYSGGAAAGTITFDDVSLLVTPR